MNNKNNQTINAQTFQFWITGLMTALTIISAVTAGFITDYSMGFIPLWSALPGAVFCYILVISLDNIQSECFGFAFARRTTWISFASEAFMTVFFELVLLFKHPVWVDVAPYRMIFHSSIRAAIASPISFAVGSFINSYVINAMKVKLLQEKKDFSTHLWMRTWLSTVLGQLLDAFIFIFATFAFTMPWKDVFTMFLGQYTFKLVVALIWCIVESPVINWVKKATGCDSVETDKSKLKIFSL